MENVIYNELMARGFSVDVGMVEHGQTNSEGKRIRTQLEVDFVVNRMERRYYIQSALSVADESKRQQETRCFGRIGDSYTKMVVVQDNILPWTDEKGVQYINVEDFLLQRIDEL